MTIEEMIRKKKEYGYTNQQIADLSGVPLGTVQKIFSGNTESPRYQTICALTAVFSNDPKTDHKNSEVSADYTASSHDPYLFETADMVMENSGYNYGTSARTVVDNSEKTLEDYLALPEGTRIELIDGRFYDMAAPTTIHQRIGMLLAQAFENYIDSNNGSCIPFVAPTDVQLDCDDKTMVQPDVLVVCDRSKIIKARVIGAPDLIVEVLSPNNWYMDTTRKLNKYKNAGVREYWIVIPEEKSVIVYDFEHSANPMVYSFEDSIPVSIWDNRLIINFKTQVYDKISFMYDTEE
ncbi:MAG: Uma2 family endonuclease [Eubacterium sp.]|nr:Uma2 family endonuclease [Eubacterium sp.]